LLAYLPLPVLATVAFFVGRYLSADSAAIRLVGIDALMLAVVGMALVLLQPAAGLPQLVDPAVSSVQRWIVPLVIGAAFGCADVFVIEGVLRNTPHEFLPPYLQPFPYSLLLYGTGAVYIEVLYRLAPLTIILALARRFLKSGRMPVVFWIAAILLSMIEPIQQFVGEPAWFAVYAGITGFGMNLLQALYYRRSGWFGALAIRYGHYLIWHIALGIYVELAYLR
jgi:hypothetical protein